MRCGGCLKELGQKAPLQVFQCLKGTMFTRTAFVCYDGKVVKAAPSLSLSPLMSREDAIYWLESRDWKVERLDVG